MSVHSKRLGFLLSLCLVVSALAVWCHAESDVTESRHAHSLPSSVAGKLRSLNTAGQRESCHESNIFIHGYEFLGRGFNEVIWFLGAPDYLCDTNSFVAAIVDKEGNWTIGKNSEKDWNGSYLLDGAPRHFAHNPDSGMFLVTEWQIEGPGNRLYYSREGEVWVSLRLPPEIRKSDNRDCCHAAPIGSLCVADSGSFFVAYDETEVFEARQWVADTGEEISGAPEWRLVEAIPEAAICSDSHSTSFIPRSLRAKTKDGAIFDVYHGWSVRIPGPTK